MDVLCILDQELALDSLANADQPVVSHRDLGAAASLVNRSWTQIPEARSARWCWKQSVDLSAEYLRRFQLPGLSTLDAFFAISR